MPKQARLKSRKQLQQLFSKGNRIYSGPVKLLYQQEPVAENPELKCGVGVNSRYFKKAVDRNRIKRLLREAYRLQQQELKTHFLNTPATLSVFILFTGKELPQYSEIYEHVGLVLKKLLNTTNAMDTKNS